MMPNALPTPLDGALWDAQKRAIARRLALRQRRVIPAAGLRPAAVVVPLVPSPHGLTILLTRRTDEVEHHKGEICFPGGRVDPEDAGHLAAALREAREEVGIFPQHLSVLGPLDDFVSSSGYLVRPFAATVNHGDYPFLAAPREVAEILLIPADHLLDPANHEISPHPAGNARHRFHWRQRVVWGMTASILDHFLSVALPGGAVG